MAGQLHSHSVSSSTQSSKRMSNYTISNPPPPVHSGGSFLPFLDLLLSQHRNIPGLILSMYAKADSSPDATENKTILISALAATVQKRILF